MQVILFSKDRPLQLHATLTSFERNCSDVETADVAIIYTASSGDFGRGYQELQRDQFRFASLTWIREQNFKHDLLVALNPALSKATWRGLAWRSWVGSSKRLCGQHVLFLVDDTLFVRSFSLEEMTHALSRNPKILAFSLRLGRNTTTCYSRNRPQRLPIFSTAGKNMHTFRWVGEEGDFGYPLEISSSLYRTSDLIKLLSILPYANPNRLEQALALCRRLFAWKKPQLLCFDQSVAFCAPVNKVQSVIDNRASNLEEYSSEALNRLFLEGLRVDVNKLDNFLPTAAHQEIELPLLLPSAQP